MCVYRLSCGREVADRDIVQFVPFRKFVNVREMDLLMSVLSHSMMTFFLVLGHTRGPGQCSAGRGSRPTHRVHEEE